MKEFRVYFWKVNFFFECFSSGGHGAFSVAIPSSCNLIIDYLKGGISGVLYRLHHGYTTTVCWIEGPQLYYSHKEGMLKPGVWVHFSGRWDVLYCSWYCCTLVQIEYVQVGYPQCWFHLYLQESLRRTGIGDWCCIHWCHNNCNGK